MKIIKEKLMFKEVSKYYEIEIKGGKKIGFTITILENNYCDDYDIDVTFSPETKRIYDKLSLEKREEIDEFANSLAL